MHVSLGDKRENYPIRAKFLEENKSDNKFGYQIGHHIEIM